MIAALLGYPGAGKRSTIDWMLANGARIAVVDSPILRSAISESPSLAGITARRAVDAGLILSDDLVSSLLTESVQACPRPTILVGYPRNVVQARCIEANLREQIAVIHVATSPALIDRRRARIGLPPTEVAHPGAFARLDAAINPILEEAAKRSRLLVIDGELPIHAIGPMVVAYLEAG